MPSRPQPKDLAPRLLRWFDGAKRDLPWRRARDPYRIWVSEIMLQQTQVERVIPFYQRFVAAFPAVEALAAARLDDVLGLWAGLGYYSRARHLHAAAQRLVSEHGGTFPDSWEAARALPGVGEYTAGAVLSIAYGKPYAAVDANARRVLARLLRIDLSAPRARHRVERFAAGAVPSGRPGDYNQALMELGSLVCMPREPNCQVCCLADLCLTARRGLLRQRGSSPRPARPTERVALAVVRRRGRVLVAQRPLSGMWAGLWEFPNCLLGSEDDPSDSLAEVLRRDFGVEAHVGAMIASLHYGVMSRRLHLTAYAVSAMGRVVPRRHSRTRWVIPAGLTAYALPSPHRRLVHRLAGPS